MFLSANFHLFSHAFLWLRLNLAQKYFSICLCSSIAPMYFSFLLSFTATLRWKIEISNNPNFVTYLHVIIRISIFSQQFQKMSSNVECYWLRQVLTSSGVWWGICFLLSLVLRTTNKEKNREANLSTGNVKLNSLFLAALLNPCAMWPQHFQDPHIHANLGIKLLQDLWERFMFLFCALTGDLDSGLNLSVMMLTAPLGSICI